MVVDADKNFFFPNTMKSLKLGSFYGNFFFISKNKLIPDW